MQPTFQKAALAFSALRALPTVPAICLLLFALALAIPASSSVTTASWIVLFSALLSSVAGFAFSPIAGAFLFHTLNEPLAVVKVLLVASIAQQIYCVWRLRETIRLSECAPYLIGSATTLPIGLYLLCETSASVFLPLLGVLLITYGVFAALKPNVRAGANPIWGQVSMGALGGITGGLAAFPGAFVTMWCLLQGFDKHRARSIVQPFILINQLLSISALMVVRPAHVVVTDVLRYAAPAVLGAYFGLIIFNRVDTSTFNRIVGLFLVVVGLGFVKSL